MMMATSSVHNFGPLAHQLLVDTILIDQWPGAGPVEQALIEFGNEIGRANRGCDGSQVGSVVGPPLSDNL